jgi:hypothetical protein
VAEGKFTARDSKGRLATEAAKEAFLEALAAGEGVAAASRRVGRTERGYDYWRKSDEKFRISADTILQRRQGKAEFTCPDFPEFCEEYLNQPLFEHQLRWWDILNGGEPRSLHPSMKWLPGDPQMNLFNVPPGFAKSTTITTNYVTWRICKDPNVRVVIVSATEKMAKKFLYAIKQRLTHPTYSKLQTRFGPDGGFRATAESWTATEIYLGGKDDGEKDPTVQAIGMGGQIYGTRADLIVVDDAVLLKNAHQWEDQIDWLTQDIVTRLPEGEPDAKLLVVGTRVASVDLYSQLRDTFKDEDDKNVFTYFAQPAVLEYADDPADWLSLWPYTVDREGNQVAKWTGPQLKKRREKVKPSTWAMVYQQLDVSDDSIFKPELVQSAVQGMRKPGVLIPGPAWWQRERGMAGLYVVGGLDPATAGHTAAVVLGVDRQTRKIWLLDAYNRKGILPREMRRIVQDWTVRYGVNEWRIEENGFQRSFVQDDDLRAFLFSRGVILKPHWTGGNKADPDFGVASMSTLFESDADGKPQIYLPNNNGVFPAVAELTEQLIAWQPAVKNQKTDLVMALWFAIIRARELIFLSPTRTQTHMSNAFLSKRRSTRERQVVDLEQLTYEHLLRE